MTDLAEQLRALVAKWRAFADALDRKGDLTFGQICMRDAVRDCADSLETALFAAVDKSMREGK